MFVAINVLASLAAICVAQLSSRDREDWRVLVIGLSAYGLIAHFVSLVLGTTGALNSTAALMATAMVAIAPVILVFRSLRPIQSLESTEGSVAQTGSEPALWPGAMLLGGALGLQLFESGFQGSNWKWDDLSYHGVMVAQWLADARISIVSSSFQAYYPSGAEVLSLWFMLPFGDDGHVSLAGLYWLLLAASSVFGIVRGSGSSAATARWTRLPPCSDRATSTTTPWATAWASTPSRRWRGGWASVALPGSGCRTRRGASSRTRRST